MTAGKTGESSADRYTKAIGYKARQMIGETLRSVIDGSIEDWKSREELYI